MFFKKEPLSQHYSEFVSALLNGNIKLLQEKLEQCTALARYHHCGMPPVFSVVTAKMPYENKVLVLQLLKEYQADFKITHYFECHHQFHIHGSLNSIAWLLLNRGDARLISVLAKHGADIQHESVDYIKGLFKHYRSAELDHCEESSSKLIAKL